MHLDVDLYPNADVVALPKTPQGLIFETFHIESKHENSEILMEINLDNLVQALRTAHNSHNVTVRLSKKQNTPYLTLDIDLVREECVSSLCRW